MPIIKPAVGLIKSTMMARIVNKEEYELKRNEILEAAQRLAYTRGYEQMSIQDILSEVRISKGAFYHYFSSKQALLEALIERMANQIEQVLAPIVQDKQLNATQKLQRLFDTAARWKTDRKEYLLTLVNVWYADENAILRLRVQAAVIPKIAALTTTIIRQGVEEGVFHTGFPEQVSEIIFTLLQNYGDNLIKLLTLPELEAEAYQRLDQMADSHQEAVERVLGADPGSLLLFDTLVIKEWFPLSNPMKE
jgi:AcrR family transcriptional regulator